MPPRHAKALTHLRVADPRLGAWIDELGPCGWQADRRGSHFDAVARSIIYQQLSGAAAATIHRRYLGLFGGRSPAPEELVRTRVAALRGVGLSGRKVEYLQDLAARTRDGALPMDRLARMADADVIAALTTVRGIGEWTAQMFLMFRLGRPDVLPVLDLGVRKGVQRLHRLRALPAPERVATLGARWAPHRTVASWYLWKRVDTQPW